MFCEKDALKISQNSKENTWVSFLMKLYAEACNVIKKRDWHRCFPANFAKFLKSPFLQNTSGGYSCTTFLFISNGFISNYPSECNLLSNFYGWIIFNKQQHKIPDIPKMFLEKVFRMFSCFLLTQLNALMFMQRASLLIL